MSEQPRKRVKLSAEEHIETKAPLVSSPPTITVDLLKTVMGPLIDFAYVPEIYQDIVEYCDTVPIVLQCPINLRPGDFALAAPVPGGRLCHYDPDHRILWKYNLLQPEEKPLQMTIPQHALVSSEYVLAIYPFRESWILFLLRDYTLFVNIDKWTRHAQWKRNPDKYVLTIGGHVQDNGTLCLRGNLGQQSRYTYELCRVDADKGSFQIISRVEDVDWWLPSMGSSVCLTASTIISLDGCPTRERDFGFGNLITGTDIFLQDKYKYAADTGLSIVSISNRRKIEFPQLGSGWASEGGLLKGRFLYLQRNAPELIFVDLLTEQALTVPVSKSDALEQPITGCSDAMLMKRNGEFAVLYFA